MTLGSWFGRVGFLFLALTLVFLTLPTVAIFTDTTPAQLIAALGEPVVFDALWLSFRTTVIAVLVIIVIGTPAAYFLARREFREASRVQVLFP